MKQKNKILGFGLFSLTFILGFVLFFSFKDYSLELFPKNEYKLYALTDNVVSGFSTSELYVEDSLIEAQVNIRGGKAFPYAGFGFDLMSLNGRPMGFMDLSKYDSLKIEVSSNRMNSIGVRILTHDPTYSEQGVYLSYRPLEIYGPVKRNFSTLKISLNDFKTSEWWLFLQGLEKDDGLRYLHNSMLLEIINGQGVLRGIPDAIQVKSVKLYGINKKLKWFMFGYFGLWIFFFILFSFYAFQKANRKELKLKHKQEIVEQMKTVEELLKNTDKSIVEIALAVGESKVSRLEKHFYQVYKQKPLDYRRSHA